MLYIANTLFILLCVFGLKVGICRICFNWRNYKDLRASFLNFPEETDKYNYDCRFALDACIVCFSLLLLTLAFM